ncbi:unnamed protein product, partial [Scytosiphon promiscuus]
MGREDGRRGGGGGGGGGGVEGSGGLDMEGGGGHGNGAFGARLQGVELGHGMIPHFDRIHGMGDARDSSPGPFHEVNAG